MKKSNSNLSKANSDKREEYSKNNSHSIATKTSMSTKNSGRKQWLSKTMCEPNFSCAFCNATFVRIDSMQSHLRQHQKLQPELEGEIFLLQKQLQQQSNQHQPIIRSQLKKQNAAVNTINVDTSPNSIITQNIPSKPEFGSSPKLTKKSNRSLKKKLDDLSSSSSLPSSSLAAIPVNSELIMSQDNNHGPITLIVSPEKTGKALPTSSHNELQQISPNHLQGIALLQSQDSTPQTPNTTNRKSAPQPSSPLNTITLIQQPNGQVNFLYEYT